MLGNVIATANCAVASLYVKSMNFLTFALSAVEKKEDKTTTTTTADIASMLSGDGAAGQGGSLETASKLIDTYGSGTVSLGRKVGIYIAAIAVIGVGIGLLVHGNNSGKLAETKSGILPKVAGAVLIFSVVGVLVFLQSFGESLFK